MIWAPLSRTSSGVRLFTVPRVPTGMKTGVSTTPRLVVRRPRRAAASVATSANVMAGRSGPRGARRGDGPAATRAGSFDERGVAIGVEAIAGAHGVGVGIEDQGPIGERRHQHEQ